MSNRGDQPEQPPPKRPCTTARDVRRIDDQFLAELRSEQPSVETLANLVKEYGGEGDLLWVWDGEKHHFERCIEKLSEEQITEFLRLLLVELPGLPLKHEKFDASGCGPTILHIAARGRAPASVIQSLVDLNRDSLTVKDHTGCLPIHEACGNGTDRTMDLATVKLLVDEDPSTVKMLDEVDALPLHYACSLVAPTDENDKAQALEAVQLLIDVHPEALKARDIGGKTPIMIAICNTPRPVPHDVLQLLLRMIQHGGPKSLRVTYSNGTLTALHNAGLYCPNKALFSTLIGATPDALQARDYDGRLPLHWAFRNLMVGGPEKDVAAIQLLIDAYPGALDARDDKGRTPIATAFFDDEEIEDEESEDQTPRGGPSPELYQFLKDVIRRFPKSVGGTCKNPKNGAITTALEMACRNRFAMWLAPALIEASPASLLISLTGDLATIPTEIASKVKSEALAMFLAMVEVLVCDATQWPVPNRVRDQIRQAVRRVVPADELTNGSFEITRAFRSRLRGEVLEKLRSETLVDKEVQDFLTSNETIQDQITRVYRVNKAGRLDGTNAAKPESTRLTDVSVAAATDQTITALLGQLATAQTTLVEALTQNRPTEKQRLVREARSLFHAMSRGPQTPNSGSPSEGAAAAVALKTGDG